MAQPRRWRDGLSVVARKLVEVAGSAAVANLSLTMVIAWAVIGLSAGFTDHWLEALFAVSGAMTFVMVFFIQHSTARDLRAIMIKLDELISADDDAHNDVVSAEQGSLNEQEELEEIVQQRATSSRPGPD
jgi:low affinity Fe/Cu permease